MTIIPTTQIRHLNPCPFCGGVGQPMILEDENAPELEPIYFVKCYDCDARGSHRSNPFDAEAWWNQERLELAKREREQDQRI